MAGGKPRQREQPSTKSSPKERAPNPHTANPFLLASHSLPLALCVSNGSSDDTERELERPENSVPHAASIGFDIIPTMPTLEDEFLVAVETHSVDGIEAALDSGLDVEAPVRGRTPVQWLTEMYTRSDRFADCLRLLLDRGGRLDDQALEPVLLDDADRLEAALAKDPNLIAHRADLISAFTPLMGASLLHVAAEFVCPDAVRVLLQTGADVEARAALDENGLNGHTPLFHTVNSNANYAEPILRMLLEAGAKTNVRLAGITWGKGFEWETTVFDVTPVSYAHMGLLPQFHRSESQIYDNIRLLLKAAGRTVPPLDNIPNRYLLNRS